MSFFKNRRKFISVVSALATVLCLFAPADICFAETGWPVGPNVTAEAAVVIEASSGSIIYEKNCKKQMYPASTTKLITALLAIENLRIDEEIIMTHDSVYSMGWDASRVGMEEGEKLTLEQALYAILLASANEVSYAVAEHIGGGDIDTFLDMANRRAAELGCESTHFTNPHGLHDPKHYSSAYDLALIMKKCIEYDTFNRISNNYNYELPKNPAGESRWIKQTHKALNHDRQYEGLFAGKTGSTDQAKYCLVSAAERNGMTLICVVLKSDTNAASYDDTFALLDFGFANFETLVLSKDKSGINDFPGLFTDDEAFSKSFEMPVSIRDTIIAVPKGTKEEDIRSDSTITKLLVFEAGENKIGHTDFFCGDRKVGETDIFLYSPEYTIVDPAELYLIEVGGTDEFDMEQYERLAGIYVPPVEKKEDYALKITIYAISITVVLALFVFLVWVYRVTGRKRRRKR